MKLFDWLRPKIDYQVIRTEVTRLQLGPGDTLVFRCENHLSIEAMAQLKTTAEKLLEHHGAKALIIGPGMRIEGVLTQRDTVLQVRP